MRKTCLWLMLLVPLVPAGCGSSGGGGGGGITVTGQVTSRSGAPLRFAPVVINGVLYVTDFDGTFTAPGVSVPYTAVLVDTGATASPQATVYQGLTRADPILTMFFEDSGFTGGFLGSLTGGVGYPLPPNHETRVRVVGSGNLDTLGLVNEASGSYSDFGPGAATWSGSGMVPALVLAFQHDTLNDTYPFFGFTAGILNAGADVFIPQIAMIPTTATEVKSGTITFPAGYGFAELSTSVIITPALIAPIRFLTSDPGINFTTRVPVFGTATYELVVTGTHANGTTTRARMEVPQGAFGIALDPQPANSLIAPANGAANVDHSTVFSCTPSSLGVHKFLFFGVDSRIAVFTTATQVTVPDLSEYGVRLEPGAAYNWRVVGHGPFASVDAHCGVAGSYPTGIGVIGYETLSDFRVFTTAP